MRAFAIAVGLALGIAGCASKPKVVAPPPPPPETNMTQAASEEFKAMLAKSDPQAQIATIESARDGYLAVKGLDAKSINKTTPISIITRVNSQMTTVAFGELVNVQDDYLVLKYKPAPSAPREPQAGDLAVIFGKK